MSFSLENQLRLFDPHLFEELCDQLVKQDFPEAWRVDGAGGDEGIDIFAGELNKEARIQKGSKLHVWQVKFFRDGVKSKQREKAKNSLARVVEMYHPDFWTLCIPVNLDISGHKWFESLKAQYPDVNIDIWQADKIIHGVRQDESLVNSYFLKPQKEISESILESILRHLEDFESVRDLLDCTRSNLRDASDFYGGAIPNWSDIVQDFDAPRQQFGRLWEFVVNRVNHLGGRIPFAMITGRSGDGKSTVLMRLAAQLIDQGCSLVFYCKDDAQSLHADQFSGVPRDTVSFVFIDKITRFDASTLSGFFERLYRESIPVVVVAAAVHSLWEGLDVASDLANVVDMCEVNLDSITDDDIEALLDKWAVDSSRAAEYLGSLAGRPREEQIALFREKSKRQLLAAMLEAKHNKAFEAYVNGELKQLENRYGSQVRHACTYVSALHRFDLPLPMDLLESLLPHTHLDDHVLRRTHGLLVELLPQERGIVTRHALIADVIFRNSPYIAERLYEEVITNAQRKHGYIIGIMLHNLTLSGESALLDNLFGIATRKFPDNVVFLHMHAMLARHQGDIRSARELFRKATDVDPKHAPAWQAWALMEKDQSDIERARELFKKAVDSDPKNAPAWQAWALMEKDRKNWVEAEQHYLRAAETESDPKSRARIYFDISTMFALLNDRQKEEKYLLLSITYNPEDHIAHARLGRTHSFQHRFPESEKYFLISLKIKPDDYKTREWYEKMQNARNRYKRDNKQS